MATAVDDKDVVDVQVAVVKAMVKAAANSDAADVEYLYGSPTLKAASSEIICKSIGTALVREHGTTPEQLEAHFEQLDAPQQVAALESEDEKLAGESDLSKQEVETAQKHMVDIKKRHSKEEELARQKLETAMKHNNDVVKKVDINNAKLQDAKDKVELGKNEPVVKLLSTLQEGGVKFDIAQVSSAISEGTHASNGRNSRLAQHTQQVEPPERRNKSSREVRLAGKLDEGDDDEDNDEEDLDEEDLDGQEEDRPTVAPGSPDSDSAIKGVGSWLESPADLSDNITNEEWDKYFNDVVTTDTPGQSPSRENQEKHPLLMKIGGGKVPHGTLLKSPKQVPPPPPSPNAHKANAEEQPEEEDDEAKRKRKVEGKLPVAEEEDQQPEAEKKRHKPSSSLATRGASSSKPIAKKRKAPNGKRSKQSDDHCKHARARTRSNKAKAATPEAPEEEEEEHDKLKFLNYLKEELGPDNVIVEQLRAAHKKGDAATFMVHQTEWYDLSKLPEIRDKFGDWNKKMMPTKGGVGFILQFDQAKRPGHFCNFTRPLNEIYADIKRLKDTYPDHGYDLGDAYETFNKKFDRKCMTSKNKDRTEEPYYCTKGGKTNCFENLRTVCERCTKPILDWEQAYQIQEKERELAKSKRDLSLQNVDDDESDTDESQSGDDSQ